MQIVEHFESGPLPISGGACVLLALLAFFLLLAIADLVTKRYGEDDEGWPTFI